MSSESAKSSAPPFGRYASWARGAALVMAVLAFIGSLVGGKGDVAGTFVALVLNPIGWLAVWFWFKSNRISCPHCGSGMKISRRMETLEVGATLICVQCSNVFRKPAMSGQTDDTTAPANASSPSFTDTSAQDDSRESPLGPKVTIVVPSVRVVEPQVPPSSTSTTTGTGQTLDEVTSGHATMRSVVAESHEMVSTRTAELPGASEVDPVIMRVDGKSSFLTLKEHGRRGWKEIKGCDISNMSFHRTDFMGADFQGVRLDGSIFHDCKFTKANLTNVSGRDCSFEHSSFAGARLRESFFDNSCFRGATFCSRSDGKILSASIDRVSMTNCNFKGALFAVNFTPSNDLKAFTIKRTQFSHSDLSGCDLQSVVFQDCEFTNTQLFGASMQRCNLERADLRTANLINANLSGIVYSDESLFPDGFLLPSDTVNADKYPRAEQAQAKPAYLEAIFVLSALFAFTAFVVVLEIQGNKSRHSPQTDNRESSTVIEPLAPPNVEKNKVPEASPNPFNENPLVEYPIIGDTSSQIQRVASQTTTSTTSLLRPTSLAQNRSTPVKQTALDIANRHYSQRQFAKAIQGFREIIAREPTNPAPKNNLAQLLATCPEDEFRNGTEAVDLAMEAYRLSGRTDWKVMCTLSVAYAEVGDFESASHWAKEAKQMLGSDEAAIEAIRIQLQKRQPYRW